MKKLLQGLCIVTLFINMAAYGCCGPSSTSGSDCCYSDCCNSCFLGPCDGYPFLSYRSQSVNAAREIAGWQQFINQYDMDSTYGAFSVALEYTRSFRPEYLANFLFGNDLDNCNTLIVQGSQVDVRNKKAWLADYLGLSPEYNGRISFCPRIQNVIVDLNMYLGLDELAEGLFFRVHAPIVWTKWQLNMCEHIKEPGEAGFPEGYMSETAIERVKLSDSFIEAMSGTATWGDMKEAIKFGRMTNCDMTKTRLSDIHTSLGWNFKTDEDYHFGVFIRAAFPTGNRPKGCYLFEPIVGNGKHWELGAGLTTSYIFWRSCEYDDRYMGIWLDAIVTHLFETCQCRSFDFCNKPNSRYMLLEEMGKNEDTIQSRDETVANYQYKKNLIPAINWSTVQVDVKIDAQADIALKVGYVRDNWSFDLGYNLWARTGEKFCTDCCDDCCDSCCGCPSPCPSDKKYAIKGDSFIYGKAFKSADENETVYPISATQSCATIRGGKNYPPKSSAEADSPSLNLGVDNPAEVFADDAALSWVQTVTMNTSIQPVLVHKKMLNLGKSPSAITHKIFGSITYTWKDRCENDWVPFFGMGWEIEFAQKNCDCCDQCCNNNCNTNSTTVACNNSWTGYNSCCNGRCDDCCDTCKRAGVYQYGLWLKGGLSFD